MKIKENYDDTDNDCKHGFSVNFLKSLTSQISGILGVGSFLDNTGVNVESELMKKIFELESQLKTIKWKCTQQIFLEQDKNNANRVSIFQNLHTYFTENNIYISRKYIFKEERLGILEAAISILTSVVVFVILYFLKFK